MKNDKETKEKLLISAKQEFMEKGYMQASLRSICKNAGVTTGALYFFFQDKEDLFASLVEEPLKKLYMVMNAHYSMESERAEEGFDEQMDISEDVDVAKQVIHYMYFYYDEFQMILTKSQGSRFEHSLEKLVEITEKHYRIIADKIAMQKGVGRVQDYMIHWSAHLTIDIFVHILTHAESEEVAMEHMEPIIKFMLSGWISTFR